jgi:hypothetical protein
MRLVLAAIAAAAGRDCGQHCTARDKSNSQPVIDLAAYAIRSTRDSHTDAALAMRSSLFRFPSVASRPRFSHDPVNLAPDYDG